MDNDNNSNNICYLKIKEESKIRCKNLNLQQQQQLRGFLEEIPFLFSIKLVLLCCEALSAARAGFSGSTFP